MAAFRDQARASGYICARSDGAVVFCVEGLGVGWSCRFPSGVADLRLQAKAHSRVLGDFWPGRISPGAVNWHWPALSSFHDLWFFFGGGARLIWLMMCFSWFCVGSVRAAPQSSSVRNSRAGGVLVMRVVMFVSHCWSVYPLGRCAFHGVACFCCLWPVLICPRAMQIMKPCCSDSDMRWVI